MWTGWRQNKVRRSHSDGAPGFKCLPQQQHLQRRRGRTSRALSLEIYHGECWLETMPLDVMEVVLACLDHVSLHAFELANRFCVDTLRRSDYWKCTIDDRLVCYEDPNEDRMVLWKRMHCMKQRHAGFSSDALLTSVVACDSPNDFSVPPTWLLFKSRCWFWMEKLLSKTTERDTPSLYVRQLHCGCGYHVPCFWSSGGSPSPDVITSIDFSVRPHCFLTQVQFVPYQAYWLDDHPAFAPKQVSFTLLHRTQDELCVFYESPVYPVTNEMSLHEFDLPKTVWTASGTILRVHLIGRTQRAPLEERPWIPRQHFTRPTGHQDDPSEEYYCCLSYVNATGFVVQDDETKKSRRWWHH